MLRRALVSKPLAALGSARGYTDYTHFNYPVWTNCSVLLASLWISLYVGFLRAGTVYANRSSYKEDNLRIWRRKLGKGYKWAEDWGPEVKTIFKNLPDRVE
jgi:hypothetical protein